MKFLTAFLFAIACLIFVTSSRAEQPPMAGIMVYHGRVLGQDNVSSQYDGPVGVNVETDEKGVVNFRWTTGLMPPRDGCFVKPSIADVASKLKPGDVVEIHTRLGSTVLCGDEAAVVLLNSQFNHP